MAQIRFNVRLRSIGRIAIARSRSLIQYAGRNSHTRIMAFGVMLLLLLLPSWLRVTGQLVLKGSSDVLLNIGLLYLGSERLWQQRQVLQAEATIDEDRVLGHLLILGGAACMPFFFNSASFQALIAGVIVLGMIISHWGLVAIQRAPLAIALILLSLYPDLGFLGNTIRRGLTGQQLEILMASSAAAVFSMFGHPVITQGPILVLSDTLEAAKAVEVASGCSGFDLAFTIAGFGFIMGLYFKQSWQRITALMGIGVFLALVTNIPRIMLLAIAIVYWGKNSFEFWHGPFGGQIFAAILLTLYYYIAMAIINFKSSKNKI